MTDTDLTIKGMTCIGGGSHHGGADEFSKEMSTWNPPRISFDDAHLAEKDKLDARTISSSRDYPLVASAFKKRVHRIIGPNYRVEFNPIPEFLPLAGMNEDDLIEYWMEWGYNAGLLFQADTQHPEYIDARKQSNWTQLVAQMSQSESHVGEVFYTMPFLRKQLMAGERPFGTAIQTIDPGRLYNPDNLSRSQLETSVNGFQYDKYGFAYSSWVNDNLKKRSRTSNNHGIREKRNPYSRVRKAVDGVTQFVYVYDSQFPGMSRGRNNFSSGLTFTKMLMSAEQAVLRATRIHAQYAAYIQTRFPEHAAKGLMSPEQMVLSAMKTHQHYYKGDMPKFAGSELGFMAPGDELVYKTPSQPVDSFPEFRNSMFTHLAAAVGMGYSTFSGDFRRASFSSVQAEVMDNRQSDDYIKANIIDPSAFPYVRVWMEENISNGRLPIRGLKTSRQRRKYFKDHSSFLANVCFWGAAQNNIDPVKQAVSDNLEMDGGNGSRTREMHLAQRYNIPFKEWVRKKAREKTAIEKAGLEYLLDEDNEVSNSSGRVRPVGKQITTQMIAETIKQIMQENHDIEVSDG